MIGFIQTTTSPVLYWKPNKENIISKNLIDITTDKIKQMIEEKEKEFDIKMKEIENETQKRVDFRLQRKLEREVLFLNLNFFFRKQEKLQEH